MGSIQKDLFDLIYDVEKLRKLLANPNLDNPSILKKKIIKSLLKAYVGRGRRQSTGSLSGWISALHTKPNTSLRMQGDKLPTCPAPQITCTISFDQDLAHVLENGHPGELPAAPQYSWQDETELIIQVDPRVTQSCLIQQLLMAQGASTGTGICRLDSPGLSRKTFQSSAKLEAEG